MQIVDNDPTDLQELQFEEYLDTLVCDLCLSGSDEELLLIYDGKSTTCTSWLCTM